MELFAFLKIGIFAAPAFPLESVYDPTGAGDKFCWWIYGLFSKLR